MRATSHATAAILPALLVSGLARAQAIGIDDLILDRGGPNTMFASLSPHTSLHIYAAATLRERGICGGAVLLDVAVLPYVSMVFSSSGVYSTPQALLQLGHVVHAPQAGAWSANLINPITAHSQSSGPYSFPWTVNTFASLPGLASTGFVWDGEHDIGLLFSAQAVPTGRFMARASSQTVHAATDFPPPPGVGDASDSGALKVRLTFAPGPPCATHTSNGTGCYREAVSFYESFRDLEAFDLAGSATTTTVLRATPTGFGYAVAPGSSAWQQPSGQPLRDNRGFFPTSMADDSFSERLNLPFSFPFPGGSTNIVHASANGFVLLGPTGEPSSDPSPTVAEVLTGRPRLYPLWADLDPSPSGPRGVYFDVDPSGQAVYITWNDCRDGRLSPAGTSSSITLQCVLRSSGEFEFRYRGVAVDQSASGAALVGWSPGSVTGVTAVDPRSIDLSHAAPFTTHPDATPLRLSANAPALGASWRIAIQPISGLIPQALLFFGSGSLPGPDLGAVGAPGCRAYSTADITSVGVAGIGGVATATATIPMNPQLLGISFTAQAGTFTFRNPLGLLTSNGMQFVVGY